MDRRTSARFIARMIEGARPAERNENWIKNKCVQRAKFPIIGFVPETAGIAALYLGKKEARKLPTSAR
jgi:bifunctional non-homologous end joining protein LigD